ncbi:unnamed protein product [Mytilus coruscus]|uniref:Mab-21-like HhH/H2TH-like domain-containing protein n=1 Tax=Mytilus coruscus TaxID=42192 RepID=A0A6J8AG37_MYTCO|nr:unnamed protein product [Mytilus coruscus]
MRQAQNQSINKKSQEASTISCHDEDDSVWLFDVLKCIGVNESLRKTCERVCITVEILETFTNWVTRYKFGSSCEGTFLQGAVNDLDILLCDERLPVIEDISTSDKHSFSLLIVRPFLGHGGLVYGFIGFRNKVKNSTKTALFMLITALITKVLDIFNIRLLEYYYYKTFGNIVKLIEYFWLTLDRIHNIGTITEHTTEETKRSLSLWKPYIYTCLTSNISAMAIRHPNPKVRDFLLLGSFIYFMRGGLSGHLKFISVLYAAGLYDDCEWWSDQLNLEYIKYILSFCCCRLIQRDSLRAREYAFNSLELKVSTCISFFQTELAITPDALKYEMFRYFGISLQANDWANTTCRWHYRAVIDNNVYYFLLKSLIKRKLRRTKESVDALQNIGYLLFGINVRHRDVAYNVLAWSFSKVRYTPRALYCLTMS